MSKNLKHALLEALDNLHSMAIDKLLDTRYQRLMQYGQFTGGD